VTDMWNTMAVEDLIQAGWLVINDGYRAKNSELSVHGLPFARAGNINGGFRFNDADRVPNEALVRVGAKRSRVGDVVFTSKGSVGRFAFVAESTPEFVYSPQLCFWRSMDELRIDPRWLYYWMNGTEFRLQYKSVAGQTDMAEYVSLRDQRAMKIALPPLPEQRRIAKILGDLDDKIELNRKMNETLEQMARALFKSWFIDFDPVRAKMDGRMPEGMDADTAALFPSRLVESELGLVPEGWEVRMVSEFIERKPVGQKYEQKTVSTFGSVPVLDQGKSGIIGYHNNDPGVAATLDCPVAVFANHTCHMRIVTYSFSTIQNVLPFIGCGVDTYWAYYATEGRLSFSEYKGHWPDFVLQKSVVPPREMTDDFGLFAKQLIAQVRNNEHQSRTLASLRDTLLPKLMRGEII
jgi:type I restriction enzyme S subunit